MSPAKTGILLLYAAAVAESTRLQATAVVIGDILSPHPLTVPPILVPSSANQQQQQRRGSSGTYRVTQVLRDRRATCGSVGADYGRRCERRKYTGQTHNPISCTKCLDSRHQSASLAARTDNTSERLTDGSTAAHGSYSLYGVNDVSSHGADTTGKRGSAGCEGKDSRIWETRSFASIDSGTHRGGTCFFRSAGSTSVRNYVAGSTIHSKSAGSRRRVMRLASAEERRQCPRLPSFAIPLQHRLRIPENSQPPLPVVGFQDGGVQRRDGSSRVRAAEGLNATSNVAGSVAKNSTAAAASSVFTESWLSQAFGLPMSLSASAAMPHRQAAFLSFCPLYLLSMTRTPRGAVVPASALHLEEGRRHVSPAAAAPHTWPYHRNPSYIPAGKQTPVLRVASTNDASALSNSCMSSILPAHYSFSRVFFAAHSSVPSFIPQGTATTYFLLRSAPRLCATSAPLTSSSRSLVPCSSACAKCSASSISSSRAASSLVSASFSSPSRSAASSPARQSSPAWLSFSPRIQPASAASHPSLFAALFSRSPPSSALGSLLSPRIQTNMQPEQSEKLKEKLKYIAALVQGTPVILFMKGTPTDPACGFSRMTYQLLELAARQANEGNGRLTPADAGTHSALLASTASASTSTLSPHSSSHLTLSDPTFFRFINVLEDDLMREGIKQYSEWPTIPQLYICGQFVGGADVTAAMFRDNSLQSALRNALLAVKPQSSAGL